MTSSESALLTSESKTSYLDLEVIGYDNPVSASIIYIVYGAFAALGFSTLSFISSWIVSLCLRISAIWASILSDNIDLSL